MQEYKDIVRRFDLIFKTSEEPLLVTRKEAEQLYEDMKQFIKEDHPKEEIRSIYPIGMMETLGMLLDDSNPDKSGVFKADK
ncbi:hypothetical protein [Longibaculum muris]|uniref:hypothetical protein n=1 Tax=Longibaculum muris TaxID=1796628 RepID=UPI0022E87641|nr:hypothetical protein [Longibaculum muris]